MGVWYASREDVKSALDVKETARSNAQVDRAIEAASRMVEETLGRRFYPELATRYFDWPNRQYAPAYRLWLESNELISVATLTSGGTTIAASDYLLRRSDNLSEAPYDYIDIDLSSTAAFSAGSTFQQSIAITGLFGYKNDHADVGTLDGSVSSTTATTINVSDSANIGVGDLIHPDYGGAAIYEHMIVTEKTMKDSGVNIDAGDSLTASAADVTITMSTATDAPTVGETILIDSERMLVIDKAGLVLTVERAYDGSVLASHAGGADIYAPRTLTVTRGAVGTTAATHLDNATLAKHLYPGPVRELTMAEAINNLLQASAGYARTSGAGDNERETRVSGLKDLRAQVLSAYGRTRIGAV